MNLGQMIAAARYDNRLSLQNVADGAGVTKAHVWELEKGRTRNPKVNTLVGLAKALKLNPVELFKAAMKPV